MSNEMTNQGLGEMSNQMTSQVSGENSGANSSNQNGTRKNESAPYPKSYGTDENTPKSPIARGPNQSIDKRSNSQENNSQQDPTAQRLARGTVLTEPTGGIQNADEYNFEFSPETIVDTVLVDDFKNFAMHNQIDIKTAQQVARFYESVVEKANSRQEMANDHFEREMRESCENDEEYGGSKYYDNMRYAKAAMTRFDDGTLEKILTDSGFGSHPEVVRFMYRVGRSLSEKNIAIGQKPERELSAAELFYPSMRRG